MRHISGKRNKLPAVFGCQREAGHLDRAGRVVDDLSAGGMHRAVFVNDERQADRHGHGENLDLRPLRVVGFGRIRSEHRLAVHSLTAHYGSKPTAEHVAILRRFGRQDEFRANGL